ncbi:MAG: DUF1800 domain-containing protein [Gaiellaceae bacterium]
MTSSLRPERELEARLPVYRGHFGRAEAERLLWRAGFGPRRGEAKKLSRKGLNRAVESLVKPRNQKLVGPRPRDEDGRKLAPRDAYGHDALWWLDRMVRTSSPLVERMTLIWHDWFATSDDGVGSQRLMLRQNELFRRRALSSFQGLLLEVTRDPAMLIWLSGIQSTRESPNENYARELMELFTLGANRGYSEADVREQARALTGWTADYKRGKGFVDFHYEAGRHDPGVKTVFGKRGRFDWEDACMMCLRNRSHPSFFVTKLWSYFIPTPPSRGTQRALQRLYVRKGYAVRPVVRAILKHPALYTGPRMTKPPAVYLAGLLRARGRSIDTDAWVWISQLAGQRLFNPPNVAGWDDDRWLNTSTYRGRWIAASVVSEPDALDPGELHPDGLTTKPDELVQRALAYWGNPSITRGTRGALTRFAQSAMADADEDWKRESYPIMVENALRQLVATSPDLQTS